MQRNGLYTHSKAWLYLLFPRLLLLFPLLLLCSLLLVVLLLLLLVLLLLLGHLLARLVGRDDPLQHSRVVHEVRRSDGPGQISLAERVREEEVRPPGAVLAVAEPVEESILFPGTVLLSLERKLVDVIG